MSIPYVSDLWHLLVPHTCHICRQPLVDGERVLCLSCLSTLPRLHYTSSDNEAEHRVFGRVAYEHGASFCYYQRGGDFASLIQSAKYDNQPWVDEALAQTFAAELTDAGWPFDIDVIVPVPAHWWRLLRRGHNQSESIAKGLATIWHLPVESHCLYKHRYTKSQVGRTYHERMNHMAGTFATRHAERLRGRHILVVDDVLTSGATLEACCTELCKIKEVRVSFLTLGLSN